ncbi:MAG TPA: Na/Pi cotransporter family protein [Spirochaetota bacterium]|nr:Na/Pi cotransporter family protein [Spirochaetota bacterium]HPF06276.1 Na/Pi cotransporter family protein [Spirochaetota bacterium]HPJ43008.1 Na/Pi cotransporter family protein [Spirochaetota bacterium]HPR37652.1 Na/Pi cotransporter family protein [Spirochaetota bacterium]HRX46886.1 Na/Pi cotransporter family protein [Spirochaetota bacterium]
METSLIISISFKVLGGLAIFLLGMNYMSGGIQAVAGTKLRQLISAVTNNRLMALGVGFSVTALIQSSSATSVIVVGFVNSGVMTLVQAIGVILGADIGTTVTGWILVLNIGEFGLPLIGIFGIMYLFARKDNTRYLAMMIMGLGMIFFGLELMKLGFKPLREVEAFLNLFHAFRPGNFTGLIACAMTGAFITGIVQSSSASVGIVMGMASTGIMTFDTAVALVMGMNVGTTVTALLASLGATTNAKRAAYAHTLIKVIGLLWVLPLFPFFLKIIPIIMGEDPGTIRLVNGVESYPYIIQGIAIAHTMFNVINVLLHLPFVHQLALFLEKIVPASPSEVPSKVTKLDIRMLTTPVIVIEQSRREIINMGNILLEMLEDLSAVIKEGFENEKSIKSVFKREEDLDLMQKEISAFLVDIISMDLPHAQVVEAQTQLRIVDEYESISDYIANIMKLLLKLRDNSLKLTDVKKKEIIELHVHITDYFKNINDSIRYRSRLDSPSVYAEGKSITHHFRELRTKHLQRLSGKKVDPLMSVSYMNMLNSYRRIRDHIMNVAEAIIGEK